MERRVLIAIFLAFIVLYVWQSFIAPPPPPATTASEPAGTTPGSETGQPPTGEPVAPASTMEPPAAQADVLVGDTSEKEFRIETPDVVAIFTNRGGRLKSWTLKHFADADGNPHELVATKMADTQPLPFSLRLGDDAATTKQVNEALYARTSQEGTSNAVTLEYRDSTGLHVVKEFQVAPQSYLVSVHATVTRGEEPLAATIQWGPAIGNPSDVVTRYSTPAEPVFFRDGKVTRLSASAQAAQPVQEGAFEYAGVEDQYFLTAAVDPGQARLSYQSVAIPLAPGATGPERHLVSFAVDPGSAQNAPLRFFAGPKDIDVLAAIDPNLVQAINFGMFSLIVVPLLRTLNWIHGFVGNYGWSIVLLTIFLNALMFPLRHKSVVSMRKMQEIQPEAKVIQERYAKLKSTDPAKQKMNQELMALYKDRGVNPASGCVPMLLTMPVLFALYRLLTVAVELRGAPFMGWVHDLSVSDPYFVFPVLMGASQFWQQYTAPKTGADPAQQRMMMFMPVIMMVFFLWMPAGVALYLFVSNLWGIGQQYMTNYLIGPPNIRTVRPPAERRLKRVAAANSDAAAREK